MNERKLCTVAQLRAFLEGTREDEFEAVGEDGKRWAVVRKHLGYAHIPQRFAPKVKVSCRDFLSPYVNFHRPCFFAEAVTDAKGKARKL